MQGKRCAKLLCLAQPRGFYAKCSQRERISTTVGCRPALSSARPRKFSGCAAAEPARDLAHFCSLRRRGGGNGNPAGADHHTFAVCGSPDQRRCHQLFLAAAAGVLANSRRVCAFWQGGPDLDFAAEDSSRSASPSDWPGGDAVTWNRTLDRTVAEHRRAVPAQRGWRRAACVECARTKSESTEGTATGGRGSGNGHCGWHNFAQGDAD